MKSIKKYLFLFIAMLPLASSASVLESLETARAGTGIPQKDATAIIGTVIAAILAFLGTIFIVLIIIGGFKWMTSRGNTEKVEDARKTLTSAVIGLAVVIASYAIARFVITTLTQGTGGGASGTTL